MADDYTVVGADNVRIIEWWARPVSKWEHVVAVLLIVALLMRAVRVWGLDGW